MSVLNLAAVLHGPADVRLENREIPSLEAGEVLIQIKATGLCGSDSHYFQHGRNGDFALAHPMCLGHESSGIVVALGSNEVVGGIKVGSRVAIEPGQNCTTCSYCLGGRYNLCPQLRFASSAKTKPHLDGTLQRYFVWPARLCHVLPENINYRVAALLEPLAVVLQSYSRSQLGPGQSVLILGAGAVGLLACATAKAFGASFVAAVDIDSDRLEFGKRNGWIDATYCLQSKASKDGDDIQSSREQAKAILQSFAAAASPLIKVEEGFEMVYECTGVPSCINLSILSCKTGGKACMIGMGHPVVTVALGAALLREVDIIGVFRYANMFPKAIKLLNSGALAPSGGGIAATIAGQASSKSSDDNTLSDGNNLRSLGGIENLISHIYPLERTVEAFETLRKGRSSDGRGVVKVFVIDEIK